MGYNKKIKESELHGILLKDDCFIVMCKRQQRHGLPIFQTIYKRNGDKVIKYSIFENEQKAEFNFEKYLAEASLELASSIFFIEGTGDIFEFIRFIEDERYRKYVIKIAKYDLDNMDLPDKYDTKTVDEYLNDYSEKTRDTTYHKSVDTIKVQQWISWGISIASLGFSIIYNLLIK